jgi:hypothetical protein
LQRRVGALGGLGKAQAVRGARVSGEDPSPPALLSTTTRAPAGRGCQHSTAVVAMRSVNVSTAMTPAWR